MEFNKATMNKSHTSHPAGNWIFEHSKRAVTVVQRATARTTPHHHPSSSVIPLHPPPHTHHVGIPCTSSMLPASHPLNGPLILLLTCASLPTCPQQSDRPNSARSEPLLFLQPPLLQHLAGRLWSTMVTLGAADDGVPDGVLQRSKDDDDGRADAPIRTAACQPQHDHAPPQPTTGSMEMAVVPNVDGSEAWLLGEVKALAARLAIGAVLRPRAEALLRDGEAQAAGCVVICTACAHPSSPKRDRTHAIYTQNLIASPPSR